jgi:hypothetical protein
MRTAFRPARDDIKITTSISYGVWEFSGCIARRYPQMMKHDAVIGDIDELLGVDKEIRGRLIGRALGSACTEYILCGRYLQCSNEHK